MGIYYSETGKICTSTLDIKPVKFLNPTYKYNRAAIVIQRWWRKLYFTGGFQ